MARILTNIVFRQSPMWGERAVCICRGAETPDDLAVCRQVFRLLRRRGGAELVVTMGARVSLAYGVACALLRRRSKQVLFEVFLDDAHPWNPLWRLKAACFRLVARRAEGVICSASAEVKALALRLGVGEGRIRFVPLYTTVEAPAGHGGGGGYILSAGRTRRDLETLLKAAPRFGAPLVIVAGRRDRLPKTLPPGVKVLREIPLTEYREWLGGAGVVVVPLLPAERSTGQVALLEAMGFGKPVVATRTTGTADYIRDGENGLLVRPSDPAALSGAVLRLRQDRELAERVSAEALREARTWLSIPAYTERLLAALAEVAAGAAGARGSGGG